MPEGKQMPFDEADAALRLTRFERFDAGFDTAFVHKGDVHIGGDSPRS